MKLVSKTRFFQYLECPKDAWYRLYIPDLPEFEISETTQAIMDQGKEVEEYAKKLKIFTGFVEIKSRGFSEFKKEIDGFISKKTSVVYQPSFIADGFMIRCDFILWNSKTGKWDLYEVKGTNSMKDNDGPRDHITDLTFQTVVLERYEIDLGSKYLVHLNNEYIRGEELSIESLFTIEDCTEQVDLKREIVVEQMEHAKKYLNQEKEPRRGCNCHLFGRSRHCATFQKSHPEIPEYSVHDITRIGSSHGKLEKLIEDGIYFLHKIEDTSDFSIPQQNQIHAHKTGEEIIDKQEITKILDSYTYPLYFFDYETFSPAIPIYTGYGTWQRIPIQFSLHVIDEKEGELRHLEYLQEKNSDPSEDVAKKLIELIDPRGTIIAWNYGFEKSVTAEIGERLPQYKEVLDRICGQMKDLMEIFSKQHYVHKDFKGRAKIESVMNVLLPEMTYDNLPYTGEVVGYVWWQDIVNTGAEPEERAKKIHLIKEYCKQDTLVMVEIFRILNNIIKK